MVLRNISMLNFSLPKNSSQELKHKVLRSRTATYIVLLCIHVSTLHSHWISTKLLYGVVQKSYPYGFYCCFFLNSFVSSYRRKYWLKRSQNQAFNKKNNMTFTYHRGGSRISFRRGCTCLLLYFNTNKPHSFFMQNTSCIGKPQVISGEGGAHPLYPPPRSAPVPFSQTFDSETWMTTANLLVLLISHGK